MPSYQALGQVPHKRHTQFRKPDGGLYSEELFGEEGFSGCYSLLYHQHPPTRVSRIERHGADCHEEWPQDVHRHHHLKTKEIAAGGDPISGRQLLLYNADCTISVARPTENMDYFYRNAMGDEVLFIHEGSGALETTFGTLPYREGDYVVIPRGTTWRAGPVGARRATPRIFLFLGVGRAMPPSHPLRRPLWRHFLHLPLRLLLPAR